jgi:hypothetical protein
LSSPCRSAASSAPALPSAPPLESADARLLPPPLLLPPAQEEAESTASSAPLKAATRALRGLLARLRLRPRPRLLAPVAHGCLAPPPWLRLRRPPVAGLAPPSAACGRRPLLPLGAAPCGHLGSGRGGSPLTLPASKLHPSLLASCPTDPASLSAAVPLRLSLAPLPSLSEPRLLRVPRLAGQARCWRPYRAAAPPAAAAPSEVLRAQRTKSGTAGSASKAGSTASGGGSSPAARASTPTVARLSARSATSRSLAWGRVGGGGRGVGRVRACAGVHGVWGGSRLQRRLA